MVNVRARSTEEKVDELLDVVYAAKQHAHNASVDIGLLRAEIARLANDVALIQKALAKA